MILKNWVAIPWWWMQIIIVLQYFTWLGKMVLLASLLKRILTGIPLHNIALFIHISSLLISYLLQNFDTVVLGIFKALLQVVHWLYVWYWFWVWHGSLVYPLRWLLVRHWVFVWVEYRRWFFLRHRRHPWKLTRNKLFSVRCSLITILQSPTLILGRSISFLIVNRGLFGLVFVLLI